MESVAGSTRDISVRKQMERELRDAKSRLEATLYASEVATWTFDIQNNRVVADENLARLFSISVTENMRPVDRWSNIWQPSIPRNVRQ